MKANKYQKIQVFIKPVEGQAGQYLAFYQSDILHATFFLSFKDDIMGAIALNSFADVLGKKYESDVELCLSDEKARFNSQALIDIVTHKVLLSQRNNNN